MAAMLAASVPITTFSARPVPLSVTSLIVNVPMLLPLMSEESPLMPTAIADGEAAQGCCCCLCPDGCCRSDSRSSAPELHD